MVQKPPHVTIKTFCRLALFSWSAGGAGEVKGGSNGTSRHTHMNALLLTDTVVKFYDLLLA